MLVILVNIILLIIAIIWYFISGRSSNEFKSGGYDKFKSKCETTEPTDIKEFVPYEPQWRYQGPQPTNQKFASRFGIVRDATRCKTYELDPVKPTDITKLPDGFKLYKMSDEAKKLLPSIKNDLEKLFEREYAKADSDPTKIRNRGVIRRRIDDSIKSYALFGPNFIRGKSKTTKDAKQKQLLSNKISLKNDLNQLKKVAPNIEKIIREYIKTLCCIYNIESPEIFINDNLALLLLIKYEPNVGLGLHYDMIDPDKNKNGPVATIGFGTPDVTYDIAPAIGLDGYTPLRFRFNVGEMLIMDGSAAIEWLHGIPFGQYNMHKYTIHLNCSGLNERKVIGYQPFLKHNISVAVGYNRGIKGGGDNSDGDVYMDEEDYIS